MKTSNPITINRDVFQVDPSTREIVNQGVAKVSDDTTPDAMTTLRYELETFVCDGQYEKGLEHILETFLKNVNAVQQPGVWVSGFYGSGKSHLVKMLKALWIDSEFEDGATARGIANLPATVKELLIELTAQGKRHGGLHAASGNLSSYSKGSVRLALLSVIFKSVGLPARYPMACFVLWLKKEGIYTQVRDAVQQHDLNWEDVIDELYVCEEIHEALAALKPNIFPSVDTCSQKLLEIYGEKNDVDSDIMVKTINQALSRDGRFPLTLVALDEVQQYIGEEPGISNDVQEMVETCCKQFRGKLLFVGTGQTAVSGTSNLKKLEGRFPVRVELSDADTNTVIRTVLLGKNSAAIAPLNEIMTANKGELSRHLEGTELSYRYEDDVYFASDYPVLPSRRRFWDHVLRALDPSGTDSQLRNQLRMVDLAVKDVLDQPVGHVIPSDFLFFNSANSFLQNRSLSKDLYSEIISLYKSESADAGSLDDNRLTARACAVLFLVNKLKSGNPDIGINATADTVADLLIEDLHQGSGHLRGRLPGLLDNCSLLMKVENEYRLRTKESAEWNDKFQEQRAILANETYRVENERNDRIKKELNDTFGKCTFTHGKSKVSRQFSLAFDTQLDPAKKNSVRVWIRDGWNCDVDTVIADARHDGNQSSTVYIFIPKRSSDALRSSIIQYKAARATLELMDVPVKPEGQEARAAMETRKKSADAKINELINELFSGARVFQAGGSEATGANLKETVLQAVDSAFVRLYPKFRDADHPAWDKVLSKAKEGANDALKAVDHDGDTVNHPVCREMMTFIGSGKKGADVRARFDAPPYGWPRDAVDGAMTALDNAGNIRAANERGQAVKIKDLERKHLSKLSLKVESVTISTKQIISVRALFQLAGIHSVGKELEEAPVFLEKAMDMARRAGGEPPRPQPPSISHIDEIRRKSGNEQLAALHEQRKLLSQQLNEWNRLAAQIGERLPVWNDLQTLLKLAGNLEAAAGIREQTRVIEEQRLLLAEPDLVYPLLKSLEDILRKQLNTSVRHYADTLANHMEQTGSLESWQKLTPDKRDELLRHNQIEEIPMPDTGSIDKLVQALERYPLQSWSDRTHALAHRFSSLHEHAARELDSQIQPVDIPRSTITGPRELREWLNRVEEQLTAALEKGPVVIR